MDNETLPTYQPDYVSAPGETLEDILEDRGMSQAELAERTGRPKKTINEIIQGKTALTPETALQLERVLGVPASFWLTREQQYREFLARQQDARVLATQTGWLEEIPLRNMIRAGWITERSNRVDQLHEVLSFFGIASPAQYAVPLALFRRARSFQSDPNAVTAWLRQGEHLAQEIDCAPYNEDVFQRVLADARALTRAPLTQAREDLPALCAAAGVAVVIVPEIPQTRVCGAARWLTPSRALIQLSLRYKTDDQFWFSFFHEAAHIVRHGKRDLFLDEDGGESDEREQEANRFAMDLLIPPPEIAGFRRKLRGAYISATMVTAFAERLGVAPGIVVGRLQFEGLLQRTHLNGLKRALEL